MTDFKLNNDGSIESVAEQPIIQFQEEINNLTARAYAWNAGLDENNPQKPMVNKINNELDNITKQLLKLQFG